MRADKRRTASALGALAAVLALCVGLAPGAQANHEVSAICKDGTPVYAMTRAEACTQNGGVQQFVGPLAGADSVPAHSAPSLTGGIPSLESLGITTLPPNSGGSSSGEKVGTGAGATPSTTAAPGLNVARTGSESSDLARYAAIVLLAGVLLWLLGVGRRQPQRY
jgi:hypothetical protein